jgi:hypothetical protein
VPTNDLWPDDIGQTNIITPVSILREQAAALGGKTDNLVTAEVISSSDATNFTHTFQLLAPALSYKYQLFYVRHAITLYPVQGIYKGAVRTLSNESELIQWLGEVLASIETKTVIRALIAQSRE